MSEVVRVNLNKHEAGFAAYVGAWRNLESYNRKAAPRNGFDPYRTGWQSNIMGAIGEMALAKLVKTYWAGSINKYKSKDVGGFYEVRAVPWSSAWKTPLRLHADDKPNNPYVLARAGILFVDFVGWIYAKEGLLISKYDDRFKKNRPANWVERCDLKPMKNLPGIPAWARKRA